MLPKRWRLVFTFVAVLALVILLYIRNNRREPPQPVPQFQIPSSTPEVALPLPYGTVTPAPPTMPVIGGPTLASNAPYTAARLVRPQYTKAALSAHYEGQVKFNFILGTDGVAHNIEIVNSPGYGMDQNIIAAMKQWLWDSAFIHENQKVTLTFVFKLDH
jgi:TonB family protein